jgi:diguanylate cyclase (GGDEF)-like protein/hemerythrin-like metal-binding protein
MENIFNWDESFLVGISWVDTQHKKLVDLINDMGEIVLAHEAMDEQKLSSALNAMVEYAGLHFRDEEDMMLSQGMHPPYIQGHQAMHREFFEEASSLDATQGKLSRQHAEKVLSYLVDWLAYHILGVDQGMARQINAIQNGRSPEQAYRDELDDAQSGTEPLVTALKGLFQEVSQRNRELRELNRTLEHKVEERTADLREANRKLEALAVRDELTGLPNRRFALSVLNRLWEETPEHGFLFSVLLLDVDKFKYVNDTYGHGEGDALLQFIAARLQEAVRNDDTVCRLGGDEFLIICPHCTEQEAGGVAENILGSMPDYSSADGETCWQGEVSIGYAQARSPMDKPEDLLEAADTALYAAKDRGGCQAAGA